jgi:hypothetical protein
MAPAPRMTYSGVCDILMKWKVFQLEAEEGRRTCSSDLVS